MASVPQLADEMLDAMFDFWPVHGSLLGLPGRDAQLPDFSVAGEDAGAARLRDIMARAEAVDPATLSRTDRVTRSVILQQGEATLAHIGSRRVEYTVIDSDFGPVPELFSLLPMTDLAEPARAEGYLARLAGLPAVLAAVAERHRVGLAAGRPAIRRHAEATVAYLDRYLADREHDPLLRPAAPAGAAGFDAERDRLLDEAVRPAMVAYREVLATEVVPHGRPDDRGGLCWLPDGEAVYAKLVKAQTTTDRSPQDLHDTGLAVIAELAQEYAVLGAEVFGTGDLAEIFARLRGDATLRWNDGDELLSAAREAIGRAEAAAPQWFGRLPSQQCTVQAVPPEAAPGAPGAFYMPPALDGSRPGIYFANTHRAQERDRYASEATAFHEAVPGHHFQLTIALGLADLPMLRRLAPVDAYQEGWGLYSERLADEMGLYSSPLSRIGMLSLDSLRAARLVLDTGLHALGWSRAQAVDYMRANTPIAPVEVESEVDRYLAAPGQALGYMVGRLELQRLRARAERELGGKFDIRAFHDTVLGGGALPLTVLDEVLREWTADRLA